MTDVTSFRGGSLARDKTSSVKILAGRGIMALTFPLSDQWKFCICNSVKILAGRGVSCLRRATGKRPHGNFGFCYAVKILAGREGAIEILGTSVKILRGNFISCLKRPNGNFVLQLCENPGSLRRQKS